ncbi:hypothetical protein ACOMHN_037134 [Nucella lapillus]
MAALVVFLMMAILSLCSGTPASLAAVRGFAYGGAGPGHGMGLRNSMMDMAARMVTMAAQATRHHPLKMGHTGHHGDWTSLPGPPRPRPPMDMMPPPRPRSPMDMMPPPRPMSPMDMMPPPRPRPPMDMMPPPRPRPPMDMMPPLRPRPPMDMMPPPMPRPPMDMMPPPRPPMYMMSPPRPRPPMDMMPPPRPRPPMDKMPPPLHVAAQLGEQIRGKFMDMSGAPLIGEKFVRPHSPHPPALGGSFGMGNVPPLGGSSQLHIMEKLNPKDAGIAPATGEKFTPVGVGADYTYFASKLAAGGSSSSTRGPNPMDPHAVPIADVGHMLMEAHGPGSHPYQTKDLQYLDAMTPGPSTVTPHQGAVPGKGNNNKAPPPPSPTTPPGPPSAKQLLMSNLFAMGQEKTDYKQVAPEPVASSSKSRGLRPIPGLTAPLYGGPKAASNTADMALRAPCDLLVDAVFALDDMKNLWMAREAIRYYETQLRPSRQTRFGVVLCGRHKSFYTALHQHFSALLASLEDLQHANATLDPAQHMPDTPGYRSSNNPYPPRVSEDFAQIDAGCLETAYHLLMYQGHPNGEKLLALVGTKERWGNRVMVEEARFLHSLNISLLTLAQGALSPLAQDSLRKMASSPDKFRSIGDNVTLHALPAMIGSAVCRPQKADITVAVQRTETGVVHDPVVTDCQPVNPSTMKRTLDFGRFFGIHTDHVHCPAGLHPNLHLCECV